jgi:hypothetical protein
VPVRGRVRGEVVVAVDDADVDGAVGLVRGDHDVSDPDLVGEAEEDARLAGDALHLCLRLQRGEGFLQSLASPADLCKITDSVPADADETLVHEFVGQGVIVDTPDLVRHVVAVRGRWMGSDLMVPSAVIGYPPVPAGK